MGVYPELDNLSLPELITRFDGPAIDGDDYAFSYYSEVAVAIRSYDPAGLAFLLDRIQSADTERLRAILFAMSLPPTETAVILPLLRTYLRDERSFIRAEAIDALARLDDTTVGEAIMAMRNDPDPYVRGSVLRYLSRLFPDVAKPLLIAALRDPDYIVRENGVDELDNLAASDALPFIEPLQNDPHPHVREAARTAIENLSDSQSPDS